MTEKSRMIINSEVLSQTHLPESLLYLEKERAQLLNNVKNSVNTLVHGPCGSGKTALAKCVFNGLNGKESFAAYVDCSIYQTTYSILKEIIPTSRMVFYRSNYELIKELKKFIKKGKPIIGLDNFEQIKDKDIIGTFMSLGVCVILVTNSMEDFESLSENIRSNIPSIIRLPEYTRDQTFRIIRQIAEKALAKGSCTNEVLRKIAKEAGGNIALGINALKVSALKAETENKRKIEEGDVLIENDCPLKLTRDEKIILKILEEKKSLPSSRLYEVYLQNTQHPKGERSFRNYLERLRKKGLVKAIGEKRGRIYEIAGGGDVEGNA